MKGSNGTTEMSESKEDANRHVDNARIVNDSTEDLNLTSDDHQINQNGEVEPQVNLMMTFLKAIHTEDISFFLIVIYFNFHFFIFIYFFYFLDFKFKTII